MNLDQVIAVRENKTIYRDGDKCIKVFNENYSKADILNEALNQASVEETGLNVPKVLEVTRIDGKWAIVFEYIEGKTLAQLMKEDSEKKEEYLELFVDLQLAIHGKICPQLPRLKDKLNVKISVCELEATTRYDLHNRLEEMPKHNKVCHGDYTLSNIVITEDGTPYILDWAHATQGNASADAARTYLLLRLKGDLGSAKRYLDQFCWKSNTPKQYVQKWMPIVAASQSITANEQERELLLSWINSADYE